MVGPVARRLAVAVVVVVGLAGLVAAAWVGAGPGKQPIVSTALAGPAPPPAQNGGPCSHDGRQYGQCYIDQAWTGAVRLIDPVDTLVLNSSITNAVSAPCLLVRNADGIDLINLSIQGCDESGIRVSNQSSSRNVRIIGGTIDDTGRGPGANGSCINAGQPPSGGHPNLVIENTVIDDCGFDDLDHGIYVQTPGYIIRNNVVLDSSGNGISIRSSGLVEGNSVRGSIAAGKARIRYFNDHPCAPGGEVVIRDNDVNYGAGDQDISLLWSSGNDGFACDRYRIEGRGPTDLVRITIGSQFEDRDATVEWLTVEAEGAGD